MLHKLQIACPEEEEQVPRCEHGPNLLFYYEDKGLEQGFYGCAFARNATCSKIPYKDALNYADGQKKTNPIEFEKKLANGTKQQPLHFCQTCQQALWHKQELKTKHAEHEVLKNLTAEQLADPTQFLRPMDDDEAQAQYFFDNNALCFFAKALEDLSVSKVLCIGAPRLHFYLRNNCTKLQSFLLDIDERLQHFLPANEFAKYNMCNHYFFNEEQFLRYKQFLKSSSENLLIFTDPPFGCRTEPIAHTLQRITRQFNEINARLPLQPVAIFWIFPYFSAPHVQAQMPALQMCDYRINYTNHGSYTDTKGGRRLGSAARLFTNVPLEKLILPVLEEYKYCAQCKKYTALENRHCARCKTCPSLNGSTYRHCVQCDACVKPYYVHCAACRRCTQSQAHVCKDFQPHQRCWICRQLGHTEPACLTWQSYVQQQQLAIPHYNLKTLKGIRCFLCGKRGHNELRCKKRGQFIKETVFMGEIQVEFKT